MTAEIWADVMGTPCTACGAAPNDYCRFTVNGKTFNRHSPCLVRLRAAEEAA